MNPEIKNASSHFEGILEKQLDRVKEMRKGEDWIDYKEVDPIKIGFAGGDGIGPIITKKAKSVVKYLLEDEVKSGKVELHDIENLTIERRSELKEALPQKVLEQIKKCHVLLKGPTTTPKKGDPWPNLESANVALRRKLDLFVNLRPVNIPEKDIDWIFCRENTEGSYLLGGKGVTVDDDLAIDFRVTTTQGAERIIRYAFEYAKKNNRNRVTVVTKANIVKAGDGKFLSTAERVAEDYPEIEWDNWFIDIMSAKLIDPQRQSMFEVVVLPNLYGDIITDEAAQIRGGVGTAGSANIGKRYAVFEAIHGTAPRMVEENRAKYADPTSIMRAAAMMIDHLGFDEKAKRLNKALDICCRYEKKKQCTGRSKGDSTDEFGDYVIETLKDSELEKKWQSHRKDQKV